MQNFSQNIRVPSENNKPCDITPSLQKHLLFLTKKAMSSIETDSDAESDVPKDIPGAMAYFLDDMSNKRSRDTYRVCLRKFLTFARERLKGVDLKKLKVKHMQEYVEYRKRKKMGYHCPARVIKAFYTFLNRHGVTTRNRLQNFKPSKFRPQRERKMRKKWVKALVKAVNTACARGELPVERTFFLGMLYKAGLRAAEVCTVKTRGIQCRIRRNEYYLTDDEESDEEVITDAQSAAQSVNDSDGDSLNSEDDDDDSDDEPSHESPRGKTLRKAQEEYRRLFKKAPPNSYKNQIKWLRTKITSKTMESSSSAAGSPSASESEADVERVYTIKVVGKGDKARVVNLPAGFGKKLYDWASNLTTEYVFTGNLKKLTGFTQFFENRIQEYAMKHTGLKQAAMRKLLRADYAQLSAEDKRDYERAAADDNASRASHEVPISRSTAHAWFKDMCRRAELPKYVSMHWLRHYYATEALSNGNNVKDLQRQMGHADSSTTLNVYAHANTAACMATKEDWE